MGLKKAFKKTVSFGFNVKRWAVVDDHKRNASRLRDIFEGAFYQHKQKREKRKENFEQALHRLGMSEADLQKRMKTSKQIVLFCLSLFVLVGIYMVYLFIEGQVLSGFTCLMLSLVMFGYAFREHFNLFQMRQRRLGCTTKEYMSSLLKKREGSDR